MKISSGKMKNSVSLVVARGFLLVEVIIGAAIISLCLLSVITVGQGFLRLSFQSLQEAQASFLMEEGAEVMRSFRDISWVNISGLAPGTEYYVSYNGEKWATSTTPITIDRFFDRKITVSDVERDANDDIVQSGGVVDVGTKKVVVTVTWPMSSGVITKTTMFYLTNI